MFSDLLVGLSYVFADIVWRITIGFYGGNIVCKIVRYLQVTNFCESVTSFANAYAHINCLVSDRTTFDRHSFLKVFLLQNKRLSKIFIFVRLTYTHAITIHVDLNHESSNKLKQNSMVQQLPQK